MTVSEWITIVVYMVIILVWCIARATCPGRNGDYMK